MPKTTAVEGETSSILSKAFDLLSAFNSHDRVMTLSELSRATGLAKSTVHRLLQRLTQLGAIEAHPNGYRIGVDLLHLAAVSPANGFRNIAMPFLSALHQRTGHTAFLAVPRDFDVVFLERIGRREATASATRAFEVGDRLPASCTASGKAMLAYTDLDQLPARLPRLTPHSVSDSGRLLAELRQVRGQGFAQESDEVCVGVTSLAAPVVLAGQALAAVAVTFPTGTAPRTGTVSALRETAGHIVREIRRGVTLGHGPWLPFEA
ncbi:IclR family transcriptional regulator [Streptomyces sp. MMG1533]|uniref:IclR family transcriptional regulator n=1 Tax=Streptomyces sp. MMG1533 TaxID=1415546 RepID=UPI000A72CD6B|nr:IclR family transcriptional regulator [Streptomyces sp. MMG1533]